MGFRVIFVRRRGSWWPHIVEFAPQEFWCVTMTVSNKYLIGRLVGEMTNIILK